MVKTTTTTTTPGTL